MCDLDRFSGAGVVIRNNTFRHGGHPQIGMRIKSSDALITGNVFTDNQQLNVEVAFLQSWMEGPTHIRNVAFQHNAFVNCSADRGGPQSDQPGSFFALCGLPGCRNITQANNTAVSPPSPPPPPLPPPAPPRPSPPPQSQCWAAVLAWKQALGTRVPTAATSAVVPPFSFMCALLPTMPA